MNLQIDVWKADQNSPEKIIGVMVPGAEFRIFLFDGDKELGHLTIFRGNETKKDKSPTLVEYVPSHGRAA